MKKPTSKIYFIPTIIILLLLAIFLRAYKLDASELTVSEIKGFGKSKAKDSKDAFKEGLHDFVKMIKLELTVRNDIVDEVVNTIQSIAHTGNPGDGKIFVIDVNNTIKIRTNERGVDAI